MQQSLTIVAATPTSPPSSSESGGGTPSTVCGNTSLLTGPSSPSSGAVTIPAGDNSNTIFSYELAPNTTYWFAPGAHTFSESEYDHIQPDNGDTFIGAPGAIINGEGINQFAFASDATNVTIEYLTIEGFVAAEGESAVNQDGAANWTVENNTITGTLDGAGVDISTNDVVTQNCLTANGEYGFDGYLDGGPSLGGGPTNVTLTDNEISDNGEQYYPDTSCGCSGGGKFWETGGGTVTGNYVHNNYNVGLWIDTNNYGFNISDNYISDNYAEGIQYELSYNALISDNTLIGNGNGSGVAAIYVSESGGDSRVPGAYSGTFDITGNVLTDNWEGISLWENSNRFCGNDQDGDSTSICTLVAPATYTYTSCRANLSGATSSGSPDYFDNCRWKTQNVEVTDNTFNFTSAEQSLPGCTAADVCGVNSLFSEYGTAPSDWTGTDPYVGYVVPNNISNNQNNHFADNTYNGPWNFRGFINDLTQAQWTAGVTSIEPGYSFGVQDAGSVFNP